LRVQVIEESSEGGGGSGGGAAESDEPEEDGCDCRAAGSTRPGLGWLALGLFATGLLRRRQRQSL
jgi:MYXO-CTERM domain-containing protein